MIVCRVKMAEKQLKDYKENELALIKMKSTDKQMWPVQIEGYDKHNDYLVAKWLFVSSKV